MAAAVILRAGRTEVLWSNRPLGNPWLWDEAPA